LRALLGDAPASRPTLWSGSVSSLQDYEDPKPAKAGQHARWRELRKVQEQNMKKFADEPKNERQAVLSPPFSRI